MPHSAPAQRLLVLTYHRIGDPAGAPPGMVSASPRGFERQMRWLGTSGRAVSLDQVLAARADAKLHHRKSRPAHGSQQAHGVRDQLGLGRDALPQGARAARNRYLVQATVLKRHESASVLEQQLDPAPLARAILLK